MESDSLLPVNNYAWSKLGGECAVQLYKNSLILRLCMTEKPFVHKAAFYDIKNSFMYHHQVAVILLKLINAKGILNVGGKSQSVYNFARINNPNIKKIFLKNNKKLNMPINFMPKYFPPSDVSKASTIILSIDEQQKQNDISFLFLRQMWLEEKDVGDENNIKEACNSLDLNFDQLLTVAITKIELYNSLAEKAAQLNVFGSPTYVVNKEIFWGQDRLDFLEEFIDKNQ